MSGDSDEDWNDWESDEESTDFEVPTPDLFVTSLIHKSPNAFLKATIEKYNFNLKKFMLDKELNTFGRIRCCNYIRLLCRDVYKYEYKPDSVNIIKAVTDSIEQWSSNNDLLIPTLQDDGLIQYAATANHGFDSDDDQYWEDEDEDYDEDNVDQGGQEDITISPQLALADLSQSEAIQFLQQQIQANKQQNIQMKMLQRQVDQLSDLLQRARSTFQEYALSDDSPASTNPIITAKPAQSTPEMNKNVFGPDDSGYFASYSDRDIHEEMLSDKHRTESYENAIKQLGPLLKDKIVLDVGCGTGILSMFAAKYGAKHVIAVDAADIIDKTRDIVKTNGFESKITLIKGKIEEVVLPFDSVDIIISEWMGYYLLFESMLPSVFYARNKWLRRESTQKSIFEENKASNSTYQYNDQVDNALSTSPFASNTRLLPDVARMFVAGATAADYNNKNIHFWKDVYGFDMSAMIYDKHVFPGSSLYVASQNNVLTDNNMYAVFDLMDCTSEGLSFTINDIEIVAENDSVIDSFIVWFDTPFVGTHHSVIGRSPDSLRNLSIITQDNPPVSSTDIILTTSPFCQPTHWMQTIFRLVNVMKVQKGDKIKLSVKSSTRTDNHRHYDILIKYSFESSIPFPTEPTSVPNTRYAKSGDVYDQLFSLQ